MSGGMLSGIKECMDLWLTEEVLQAACCRVLFLLVTALPVHLSNLALNSLVISILRVLRVLFFFGSR